MAMRILDTSRQQMAVYWAPAGRDDFNQVVYAAPVEIRVRWTDTVDIFVNAKGVQQQGKARVECGDDLKIQGVLMLGPNKGIDPHPLTGMSDAQKADPFKNTGAWEIARFDNLPLMTVKTAADFYRVAYL